MQKNIHERQKATKKSSDATSSVVSRDKCENINQSNGVPYRNKGSRAAKGRRGKEAGKGPKDVYDVPCCTTDFISLSMSVKVSVQRVQSKPRGLDKRRNGGMEGEGEYDPWVINCRVRQKEEENATK